MILNLDRFRRSGEAQWRELGTLLDRLAARPGREISVAEAERLEDLYHRAADDLGRLEQGAIAGRLHGRLEELAARAYGEIYAAPPRRLSFQRRRWGQAGLRFARRVPQVFRRHLRLFWLALGLTLGGCLFGALAVSLDPAATAVLLPQTYLSNPAQRVAQAEGRGASAAPEAGLGEETEFSAGLITHNIQVSLFTLALGVTLGIGTGLLLFSNGVMLGAVAARYGQQGFGWFVAGWLLPHGAFEIPSVILAGQAGFLLAGLLLGGGREPRWARLRRGLPEVWTLFGGLCCLLVWAGVMEAFFSQHHAPDIRYGVKAAVGLSELLLLGVYLFFTGRHECAG